MAPGGAQLPAMLVHSAGGAAAPQPRAFADPQAVEAAAKRALEAAGRKRPGAKTPQPASGTPSASNPAGVQRQPHGGTQAEQGQAPAAARPGFTPAAAASPAATPKRGSVPAATPAGNSTSMQEPPGTGAARGRKRQAGPPDTDR